MENQHESNDVLEARLEAQLEALPPSRAVMEFSI